MLEIHVSKLMTYIDLHLLTKRYNSNSLKKSRVDKKIPFQVPSKLGWYPEALDYDCDYDNKHADKG